MNRLIMSIVMSIVVCGALVTGVPHLAQGAQKVTVVDGKLELVADDSIVINFKRYYITGARLLNTKNEPVDKAELRVGRKVEIFFHDRRIESIMIYPENWGE